MPRLLFVIALITFGQSAQAETLGDALLESIQEIYSPPTLVINQPVERLSFRRLDPATAIPPLLVEQSELPPSLNFLEAIVPLKDPPPSQEMILPALQKIQNEIQLSVRDLTAGETSTLEGVESLLYDGSGNPSPLYEKYLGYKIEHETLVSQLSSETNPAARIAIASKISDVERDWTLFGGRAEVAQALEVYNSLKQTPNSEMRDNWISAIERYSPPEIAEILASINASDWSQLAIANDHLPPAAALNVEDGKYQLPSVARIAFDVKFIQIDRDVLRNAFLVDRTWRSHSGIVLSDGNPDSDADAEVLPRLTLGFFIIKNLEVWFSAPISHEIISKIESSGTASIDEIPIKGSDKYTPSLQYTYIASIAPFIPIILVGDLIATPNPEDNRKWLE